MVELFVKVLFLGESSCGKTSIIRRFAHNKFFTSGRTTHGVDFAVKELRWAESTTIRLQMWDLSSHEHYNNMTKIYYRGASGAFVVFDSSCDSSRCQAEAILKWKHQIDQSVESSGGQPIPVILLVSKCDAARHLSAPSLEQLRAFAAAHGFAHVCETSARTEQHRVHTPRPGSRVVLCCVVLGCVGLFCALMLMPGLFCRALTMQWRAC